MLRGTSLHPHSPIFITRRSSPANDPWALSTVPSPWGRTCPGLDTHPHISAPVQAPALGPHPRGAFHPTWPLPHSCILNLTLWIPPLSRPQVLDSTCLGPSAASPMAPCPASTLVCALGPHQVINHRPPLVVPQITTSPSPSLTQGTPLLMSSP